MQHPKKIKVTIFLNTWCKLMQNNNSGWYFVKNPGSWLSFAPGFITWIAREGPQPALFSLEIQHFQGCWRENKSTQSIFQPVLGCPLPTPWAQSLIVLEVPSTAEWRASKHNDKCFGGRSCLIQFKFISREGKENTPEIHKITCKFVDFRCNYQLLEQSVLKQCCLNLCAKPTSSEWIFLCLISPAVALALIFDWYIFLILLLTVTFDILWPAL